MRILHVTTEYPPVIHGGLGTAVGGLVQASHEAGLQVRVLLVTDGPVVGYEHHATVAPALTRQPLDNPSVIAVRYETASGALARLLRHWRPDVVHLHVFWLWPLLEPLARESNIPVVYTVHSLDRAEYEIGHGPRECLTQWDTQAATINGADAVLALTRNEALLIEDYCPGTRSKLHVIGNGIDQAPPRGPRRRDNVTILFCGRFVDRKGIRELLSSIPEVLKRAPNSRFVLVGGHRGDTADDIDQWWRPDILRAEPRLKFTGWLDAEATAKQYRHADILVVPSWYEPFGMVVLEGMAHELAIAASDIGGPAEIIDDNRTGLLFTPRESEAMTAVLVRLATDEPLRTRLSSAGRAEAVTNWAWARIVSLVHRAYGTCNHQCDTRAS